MEEVNKKLIARKESWAEAKRGLTEEGVPPDHRIRNDRLPPGQHTTNGWPVLATARFVLFSSYDGYTTNLPLEA